MNKEQQGNRWVCLLRPKLLATWFLLITASSAVGEEIPDLRPVIEAHGYVYDDHLSGTGVKKLSSGAYALMALLEKPEDQEHDKYVVVVVDGGSVVPIHEPRWWAADNAWIKVLDINSDKKDDVVVDEYYEPNILTKIFFGLGENKFRKVFEGEAAFSPDFVELGFGDLKIKEFILAVDHPDNTVHEPLYEPRLYVFNGDEYVLAEP